jgi:isocitrate dehydrogenase
MIEGLKLGFDKPVLFERHAVGGEYGAAWKPTGTGTLETRFFPDEENADPSKVCHHVVDSRRLEDENNVAVVSTACARDDPPQKTDPAREDGV